MARKEEARMIETLLVRALLGALVVGLAYVVVKR